MSMVPQKGKQAVGKAADPNEPTEAEKIFAAEVSAMRRRLEEAWPGAGKAGIDRFIRSLFTVVRENPKLLAADRQSLLLSIQQAAQLQLPLDRHQRMAFLNIRNTNVADWRDPPEWIKQVQLQLMYPGMLRLVMRSGEVDVCDAQPVYKQDRFALRLGTDPGIDHIQEDGPRDENALRGAYAWARLKGGGLMIRWLLTDEIRDIRDQSSGYNPKKPSGPWHTHFVQMAIKTPLRNLCKMLPLSDEARAAIARDDEVETDFDSPPKKPAAPKPPRLQSADADGLCDQMAAQEAADRRIAGVQPSRLEGPCDPRESAAMDAELAEGGDS